MVCKELLKEVQCGCGGQEMLLGIGCYNFEQYIFICYDTPDLAFLKIASGGIGGGEEVLWRSKWDFLEKKVVAELLVFIDRVVVREADVCILAFIQWLPCRMQGIFHLHIKGMGTWSDEVKGEGAPQASPTTSGLVASERLEVYEE